jgi:hypothetical protein
VHCTHAQASPVIGSAFVKLPTNGPLPVRRQDSYFARKSAVALAPTPRTPQKRAQTRSRQDSYFAHKSAVALAPTPRTPQKRGQTRSRQDSSAYLNIPK